MTPSQLRKLHEEHNPHSSFFSHETLRFFGDTMRNYGVRQATHKLETPAYELYRKRPVKHGLQNSALFETETYKFLGRAD